MWAVTGGLVDKFNLGSTEMVVSRVALGGIPIQRITLDEAVVVVRRCIELGMNIIDTANVYTDSEEKIGQALTGYRNVPYLATKTTSRISDEVKKHFHLSLERLGVDCIDLYQFHNVADQEAYESIMESGGPLDVIREAKVSGQVKHIGITTHSLDMAKQFIESNEFETIMYPFNFMSSDADRELIPLHASIMWVLSQ